MAEDFFRGGGYFHPLLSEFLMLCVFVCFFFCNVGRGAFSCCLHCTPISSLIYYLWRAGTQMPTNTHSPIFDTPPSQPRRSQRVADRLECCHSERPECQCRSSTPSDLPTPATHCSSNPWPLSVAGQQGSWGWRLLYRAAEADMGEEVSNGTGGLGLINFTSHILLCHNQRRLRNKYVCFISNATRIVSQGLWFGFATKAN